ncbi:MAG TPA: nitrilase-related carbon-nitrogen hydrolase [Rhodothermales bacterium]|nr:nitrilase-related carbon-nitrogen hydrolase [Rhodothermales bacterium]
MVTKLLQFEPAYLDVDGNLDLVEKLLGPLEALDADLVVLPELFATGYFFQSTEDAQSVGEEAPDGKTTERLHAWARQSGATFVAGFVERAGDRFYNSAVVVTPRGWLGTYRKVHLFYEEKHHFAPGDVGFPVWTVTDRQGKPYRLGVMICFDWYFPESARALALQGADVIAHPSNLVRPDCPRSMPIRALENHVFTVTANRVGVESNGREQVRYIGQSTICDVRGQVLAQAGPEETAVLSAAFEPTDARDRRLTAMNDLFEDRRPEVYAPLLDGA